MSLRTLLQHMHDICTLCETMLENLHEVVVRVASTDARDKTYSTDPSVSAVVRDAFGQIRRMPDRSDLSLTIIKKFYSARDTDALACLCVHTYVSYCRHSSSGGPANHQLHSNLV